MAISSSTFSRILDRIRHSLLIFLDVISKFNIYYKIIILIVLWFLLSNFPSRWILQYGIVPGMIEILFYYVALNLGFSFARISIVSIYKRKNNFATDYFDNFILGIGRVSFLLTNIVFVFVFLYLIGLDIREFLTSISLFAVALVLIFKDYISNVLNGMVLMFSTDFKLKEYVKVGDFKGRIIDVTFLNTELRTDDGDIVFIPNTTMLSKEVINYSKATTKRIRYEFSLALKFAGKFAKLEEHISQGLSNEFESYISPDNISLKVLNVNKDQISVILEVTSQKYNFKFEDKIKTTFSRLLLEFIDKNSGKMKN